MSGMNKVILKPGQMPLWNVYYITNKMLECVSNGIEYNSDDDEEFKIKNKEEE